MDDFYGYRPGGYTGYRGYGLDKESGGRAVIATRFGVNARRPVGRVVRSVRRSCRAGTSARQLAVTRENQANPLDRSSSRANLATAVIVGLTDFACQLVQSYLRAVGRCATCAMGMMGMFKWLRKDIIQRERNGWNLAQKQCGLNNESYRNALQAFIDRRRYSDDVETEVPSSPDIQRADLLAKTNNKKCDNEKKSQESKLIVSGVLDVAASEIFDIGWVAGTEDRYLELIFAEWQNTRVSLKRHTHPECKDAVKADLDVLSKIRHVNVLLLMATTQTDDHGLVSIFEAVDCTLYHYIHDQGERIPIQGIAKCAGGLSDALRHFHMCGYVHSAISSHCVYLTSSGKLKIGGWELAMQINNPKPDKEYEERLRTEIFRWQAPELFQGYEARKESDVYGLALLIWEMCTMHVPWSGYNKADVKRQYIHWKRGVIMDLYDFPPLLNNLLEQGLQINVNKRTLDMDRMRRFLQTIEMQYEDAEPIYINQYTNNNNETGKTYSLPMRSPMGVGKSKGSKLAKSHSTKRLALVAKNPESPPKQYLFTPRPIVSKLGGNLKVTTHNEQINIFAEDIKHTAKDDIQTNTNMLCNVQNNYKNINHPNCNVEISDTVQNEESNSEEALQPWNITYRKVAPPQEITESGTTSVYSFQLESTDDESFKDARTNLRQLKEVLANKREHFFYGNESSHDSTDTSPKFRNVMRNQRKSGGYEPYKPASHKTSFEPKCSKSPGQYDSSCMKSSFEQYRKMPYVHTPDSIKNAIAKPQVSHSDPQSFFETSLWRKEKLICLSKMRKTYSDEPTYHVTQYTEDNDTISTDTFTRQEMMELTPPRSDETYDVNRKLEASTSQEELTEVYENTTDSDGSIRQDKSLQVLENALDRATKIIRSFTPDSDESYLSPPLNTYMEFDVMVDDSEDCKSVFEDMYKLQIKNDDEEIKSIERSSTTKATLLFDKNDFDTMVTINAVHKESECDITTSITSYENPSHSYDTTYSRNFICESIAEVSSEFNSSCNDMTSDARIESVDGKEIAVKEKVKSLESKQNVQTQVETKHDATKSAATNLNLMFLNEPSKTKDCKSCHQSTLPRRRSLPAALSQLRAINNSALGKLPIRRGDVPDNTVEDLYIDDEFGDSLNVNMVLLDEDLSIDEDF